MTVSTTSDNFSQNGNFDNGLSKLHSEKSSLRLEQIASLRARGIGEHIDLPQLVVYGDGCGISAPRNGCRLL